MEIKRISLDLTQLRSEKEYTRETDSSKSSLTIGCIKINKQWKIRCLKVKTINEMKNIIGSSSDIIEQVIVLSDYKQQRTFSKKLTVDKSNTWILELLIPLNEINQLNELEISIGFQKSEWTKQLTVSGVCNTKNTKYIQTEKPKKWFENIKNINYSLKLKKIPPPPPQIDHETIEQVFNSQPKPKQEELNIRTVIPRKPKQKRPRKPEPRKRKIKYESEENQQRPSQYFEQPEIEFNSNSGKEEWMPNLDSQEQSPLQNEITNKLKEINKKKLKKELKD